MEKELFENVRATMQIENMEIKGEPEKLIQDFLNNQMTEQEAVDRMKKYIQAKEFPYV